MSQNGRVRRSSRRRRNGLEALCSIIRSGSRVVFVTGAGLSAASGIPPFRESADAVWSDRTLQYATLASFLADPLGWYNDFWLSGDIPQRQFVEATPNAGHNALASIAQRFPGVCVVTQNVDRLHEDSGVPNDSLLRVHGCVDMYACSEAGGACNEHEAAIDLHEYAESPIHNTMAGENGVLPDKSIPQGSSKLLPPHKLANVPKCKKCSHGVLRPACLMFDEDYDSDIWDCYQNWLMDADALAFVGSSNAVGLTKDALRIASSRDIPVFNFNLSRACLSSASSRLSVFHVIGPAEEKLPQLSDLVLRDTAGDL